jgi:hypothetical protein
MPCPGGWAVGPYKDKERKYYTRDHCPVCGVLGIRALDNITAYHP